DWYRNLRKTPRAEVRVGRERAVVDARPLLPAEAEDVMLDYARRHPRALRSVARLLGYATDGSEDQVRELGRRMPMLALERTRT
ncbi:MAG: nitroreductase family deazaflavin-dependent oxidoreductase, partial [Thermoanaerobaculia bacterium]|nr:nitroreductase family deazaflavin-dependent oxidoreductase [Thermoanaerobaculia bacterium]